MAEVVSVPSSQPNNDPSTDIGIRGLVIVKNTQSYSYVNEATWRQLPAYSVAEQTGDLQYLAKLNVSLALLDKTVFVDLDQLAELETTADSTAASQKKTEAGQIPLPEGITLLLKEANKLYAIPQNLLTNIPSAITGDAAVLINRNAVLAAVPKSPIAAGTFCVLINFLGIEGAT